jgi:hypothetical protein
VDRRNARLVHTTGPSDRVSATTSSPGTWHRLGTYSFTKAAWDTPRLDIVAFTRARCLDIPLGRVTAVRMARTPIATELTRPVLSPGQRSWMQRVIFAMH